MSKECAPGVDDRFIPPTRPRVSARQDRPGHVASDVLSGDRSRAYGRRTHFLRT
ncbi:hypothetical protein KPATCC21470_6712 [Kitasatospora purpeofusca]